jgi:hypothetical protein
MPDILLIIPLDISYDSDVRTAVNALIHWINRSVVFHMRYAISHVFRMDYIVWNKLAHIVSYVCMYVCINPTPLRPLWPLGREANYIRLVPAQAIFGSVPARVDIPT